MMPFFDMHLHILPGIDDGAKDLEESMKMLSMEQEQGICCLCATPHFHIHGTVGRHKVFEAYTKLRLMMDQSFPQMRLYLGQEIMYFPGITDALDSGEALTMNSSRYVLLEFLPDETYKTVYGGVQKLVRSGYIPILAHVERMDCLMKHRQCMDELKAMYIPFQMNTTSLTGITPAAHPCRQLLTDGYVDLLGTDAHGSSRRPPDFSHAAQWIIRHCGKDMLVKLACENPSAILNDKLISF